MSHRSTKKTEKQKSFRHHHVRPSLPVLRRNLSIITILSTGLGSEVQMEVLKVQMEVKAFFKTMDAT
jgi:hypothetical protein